MELDLGTEYKSKNVILLLHVFTEVSDNGVLSDYVGNVGAVCVAVDSKVFEGGDRGIKACEDLAKAVAKSSSLTKLDAKGVWGCMKTRATACICA